MSHSATNEASRVARSRARRACTLPPESGRHTPFGRRRCAHGILAHDNQELTTDGGVGRVALVEGAGRADVEDVEGSCGRWHDDD